MNAPQAGTPLILRSVYRSPEHNRAVGSAKASKHIEGIAFDVAMANHDPEAFEEAARAIGFLGFGFYPRSAFMRAPAFAAKTTPVRDVLAESRTPKRAGPPVSRPSAPPELR